MLAAQAVTEGTLDLGLCVPTAKNTLFFSVGNLPIRADMTGQCTKAAALKTSTSHSNSKP